MQAAVLLPDGSSMPVGGIASVTLPCTPSERARGFEASLTPVGEMPTIDLGAVSARLANPMLTYPGGTAFTFTGTLGGGINFIITTTASPTGPSSTFTAVLVAPLSMEEALGALIGGSPADLIDAPLPQLLQPILKSTMAELTVSLDFSYGSPSSKCLYLQAAIDDLFGASGIGMSGKLCRFSVGGFGGSLGFSLDTGLSLPGELKQALAFLWPPVLNLGFGKPRVGVSVGKARMPSLPALKRPGLNIPSVYDGLRGITFAGGFPSGGGKGNAMGNFVATLSGFPELSAITAKFNTIMSSGLVTCSFVSIKDLTISLMLPSVDGSMSLGGGVELAELGLMTLISPTTLGAGITATLRAAVGTGVTLVSSVLFTASVTGPVLSLEASAAFGIEGGSGDWTSPFGMGSGVAVLMPIVGSVGIGITPIAPFLIPTKVAFAGGLRIGSTSARVAFSLDILKPNNIGLLIDAQVDNPLSLIGALVPIQPSPLEGAEALLSGLLPSGSLAISFNPGVSDITIGVGAVATYIPAGLNIQISKVRVFGGLLTIETAYLLLDPFKGLKMGAAVAPVNLFGIFSMDCGLPNCNGLGPSFSLALTPADQHFCMSGGASLSSPFGGSFGGSRGDLRLSLAMCINKDSTFYILSTVNVIPSLDISFEALGRLDNPSSISVLLVAEIKPASVNAGTFLEAGNSIKTQAENFAKNIEGKVNEWLGAAKGAFDSAGNALGLWRRQRLRRLMAAGITLATATGEDRELFANRELWFWDDDDDWWRGVAEVFEDVAEAVADTAVEAANTVADTAVAVATEVVNGIEMTLDEVKKLYAEAQDTFNQAQNAFNSVQDLLHKIDPSAVSFSAPRHCPPSFPHPPPPIHYAPTNLPNPPSSRPFLGIVTALLLSRGKTQNRHFE